MKISGPWHRSSKPASIWPIAHFISSNVAGGKKPSRIGEMFVSQK